MARRWHAAEQGKTRTKDVEMEVGAEQDAGRIGQGGGNALEGLADTGEALELQLVEWIDRLVGTGQVAHDLAHVNGIETRRVGDQRLGFLGREAEPVHAGIEMQGAGQVRRQFAQLFQLGELVDHREEFGLAQGGQFGGPEAVEHVDVGRPPASAAVPRGLRRYGRHRRCGSPHRRVPERLRWRPDHRRWPSPPRRPRPRARARAPWHSSAG